MVSAGSCQPNGRVQKDILHAGLAQELNPKAQPHLACVSHFDKKGPRMDLQSFLKNEAMANARLLEKRGPIFQRNQRSRYLPPQSDGLEGYMITCFKLRERFDLLFDWLTWMNCFHADRSSIPTMTSYTRSI